MLEGLLRTMRPHQWVKNLFVLAPLVFAKQLLTPQVFLRGLVAFFAFSFLASAVYVINDILDIEADQAHPVKRNRPIASGVVPLRAAKGVAAGLVIVALGAGYYVRPAFAAIELGYFLLNAAYGLKLKHIAYVDVLCIALGFELRVLGGSLAVTAPPSAYLLIVTFLLASFLGLGKRMHELMQGLVAHKQRRVLEAYDKGVVTGLLFSTAIATVAVYVTYTLDGHTSEYFGTDKLAFTSGFAMFGVLRFLRLVTHHPQTESPTEEMLRDPLFLINLMCWAVSIVGIIYFGR